MPAKWVDKYAVQSDVCTHENETQHRRKETHHGGLQDIYYVQNAHPPVVPREVFMQVKGEFLRREHERVVTGKRSIQNTQIPLYEKLVCCECGNTYQRFNGGTRKANWRCRTSRCDSGCGRVKKRTWTQLTGEGF